MIIINTFDVKARKYRDRKEEAFLYFIDSLTGMIREDLKRAYNNEAEVIKGVTQLSWGGGRSIVYSLIKEKNAAYAIVITSFDIFFEQTGVEVTKTDDGKDRTASYDICSMIGYSFYSNDSLIKETTVKECRFHSHRKVVSGLLSGGPGVASNKKDAIEIMRINVGWFLRYYIFRENN
ncbi:MAG: hypothetical protein EPN92_10285 [Chitinophagaceae bacterium]|nr:MAG: hypothetical protein EPN92_10285 [Chitinophagaceae bacterium]